MTQAKINPETIKTFTGLAEFALSELRVIGECSIVCGPISTGGYGSVEANIKVIEMMTRHLRSIGCKIFNNTFYEKYIWRLKDKWLEEGNTGYCQPILEEFYMAIYRSGHITKAYFLPSWESSTGAQWERKVLPQCRIEVLDLSREFVDEILSRSKIVQG